MSDNMLHPMITITPQLKALWNRPGGLEIPITTELAEVARQQMLVRHENEMVYEYCKDHAYLAEFVASWDKTTGNTLVFFKRGDQWFVKHVYQLALLGLEARLLNKG